MPLDGTPLRAFWNDRTFSCVLRIYADCGAALFQKQRKLFLLNEKYKRVLDDCRKCTCDSRWQRSSPLIGFFQHGSGVWNQVLIAKQRGDSNYYSFAFNRVEQGRFKLVTEIVTSGSATSHRYNTDSKDGTGWAVVPTSSPSRYQIISVRSGKALTMKENQQGSDAYEILFETPDQSNPSQLWTIKNDQFGPTSSEEESNPSILRGIKRRGNCKQGGDDRQQEEYPTPDAQRYEQDVDYKLPAFGNCKKFIYCNPTECLWRKRDCPNGQYFNNIKQECGPAQNASCGGAIFGQKAKVYIQNVYYQKVLDDCRGCAKSNDWKEKTDVIGFEKHPEQPWNQVLVAQRRDVGSRYYSLAFDKKEGNQVKVITDNGNQQVFAKMFDTSNQRVARWQFLPIPGTRSTYQIHSPSTQHALTMEYIGGQKKFQVSLKPLDQNDEKQQWQIQDVESG